MAKATGCTHSHALDQLAVQHGFGNWSQLMKNWQKQSQPLVPMELSERLHMHRRQAIDLELVTKWVVGRGGPKAPWHVDLAAGEATLGLMSVGFYETSDGGFEPNGISRCEIETEQDCELLEDAYVCIAQAFADQARKSHAGRHDPKKHASSMEKRKSLVLDDAYYDFGDSIQAAGYAEDSYRLNRADSINWAIRRCEEDSTTRQFIFELRAEFRQIAARDFPGQMPFLALLNDGEDLNSFFVMLGHAKLRHSPELKRVALAFCARLKSELNIDLHPSFFTAERSFSKRPSRTFIRLP